MSANEFRDGFYGTSFKATLRLYVVLTILVTFIILTANGLLGDPVSVRGAVSVAVVTLALVAVKRLRLRGSATVIPGWSLSGSFWKSFAHTLGWRDR